MKNAFIQIVKSALVVTMVTACSFDKNDPSADRAKEREQDRNKLVAQYAPVEGRYVGKLEFFDRPNQLAVDVELGLILEEENSGVDADGLPIVRPALRAYFKRSDDLNLGLMFKANYNTYIDPSNQNLILTNPTVLGASNPSQGASAGAAGPGMSSTSNQEITSIRGKLEGDVITANVLTGAGILGKISLKLKDKATEASSLGLQNDINEKVLRLYQRIEGTYEATVQIPGSTFNPIQMRVTLSATVMGDGKPVLKAYHERLDVYPVIDYNQELTVDYKTESYPQKISLVAQTPQMGSPAAGGSGGASVSNTFSFFGTIYTAQEVTDKNCIRNFTDKECEYYMQGDLTLTKNVRVAAKFVRIKDRYQAAMSPVFGRYEGTLAVKGRPSIKLTLSVFPQESFGGTNAGRRTAIQAYLQRSDKPTAAAVYSVSYNDLSGPDTYNLVVSTSAAVDIYALRGNLQGKVFKAEAISANGIIGKVDMKWVSSEVIVSSEGIENDVNQALFAEYKKIAGTYKGTVDLRTTDIPPYVASFEIRATMTASGKPELRAYYTRSDDPGGELALDLAVSYKTETYPKQITMSTADGGIRAYPLSVDGVLVEATPPYIEARFFAPKGRSADVKFVKVK